MGLAGLCLALGLFWIAPGVLSAASPDIYGYSKRALGMGNAGVALPNSYDCLPMNPANLGFMTSAALAIDVNWSKPGLWVENTGSEAPAFAPVLPEDNLELGLAYATPLGSVFRERVSMAFMLLVPIQKKTRPGSDDYRRPQFPQYDTTPEMIVAMAGLGVRVLDGLSLGAGLSVFGFLEGSSTVHLTLNGQAVTRKDVRMDIKPSAAPYLGLTWFPFINGSPKTRGLSIAFAWQGAMSGDYDLPIDVMIAEIGRMRFDLSGSALYVPHRLSLGLAGDWPELGLAAALDARLWLYSGMPPISSTVGMELDDRALDPDSMATIVHPLAPDIPTETRDSWELNAGLEWAPLGWLSLRGGYLYRASPYPRQSGHTNYLDRDVHGLTTGLGFHLATGDHGEGLTLDLAGSVYILGSETVTKGDAEDREQSGDYRFGGETLFLGASIRRDF